MGKKEGRRKDIAEENDLRPRNHVDLEKVWKDRIKKTMGSSQKKGGKEPRCNSQTAQRVA